MACQLYVTPCVIRWETHDSVWAGAPENGVEVDIKQQTHPELEDALWDDLGYTYGMYTETSIHLSGYFRGSDLELPTSRPSGETLFGFLVNWMPRGRLIITQGEMEYKFPGWRFTLAKPPKPRVRKDEFGNLEVIGWYVSWKGLPVLEAAEVVAGKEERLTLDGLRKLLGGGTDGASLPARFTSEGGIELGSSEN